MERKSNQTNMMQAVLMDEQLMKIGGYSPSDIPSSIYSAMGSGNYVINVVATIIFRWSEEASENEIYKQINQYLKDNL